MHKTTLIIVSYNSIEAVEQCQKKLLSADEFPVLLIDNASNDKSANTLREQFPAIEVIEMDNNVGYGRAANIGLRQTETPYALLLNPDLKTTAEDIRRLLEYAQNDPDNTAIWGPATERKDFTGEPPHNVKWISGSAMLFDVEKIRRVGLFDENIFLFAEETDLCERTIAAGYQIKLCPNLFFDHLVGQATPFSPQLEYLKSWHRGWGQCYRITKNGHCTWLKNPRRKFLTYRLHSLISTSQKKRLQWIAKSDGAAAFLRGEGAFDATGSPQGYRHYLKMITGE